MSTLFLPLFLPVSLFFFFSPLLSLHKSHLLIKEHWKRTFTGEGETTTRKDFSSPHIMVRVEETQKRERRRVVRLGARGHHRPSHSPNSMPSRCSGFPCRRRRTSRASSVVMDGTTQRPTTRVKTSSTTSSSSSSMMMMRINFTWNARDDKRTSCRSERITKRTRLLVVFKRDDATKQPILEDRKRTWSMIARTIRGKPGRVLHARGDECAHVSKGDNNNNNKREMTEARAYAHFCRRKKKTRKGSKCIENSKRRTTFS